MENNFKSLDTFDKEKSISICKRIISRLDIKNKNLIKGINLEGLRIVGEPNKFALQYYNQGIDEIIFMDQ